jgi:tetratricopeptide (TPR) repeat protein
MLGGVVKITLDAHGAERWFYKGSEALVHARRSKSGDDFQRAAIAMERAAQQMSWEVHYRHQLGRSYQEWWGVAASGEEKKDLVARGLAAFGQAAAQKPNEREYLGSLGITYSLIYDQLATGPDRDAYREKAAELLAHAADSDPNNVIALENAGGIYYQMGRYKDAIAYYDRAIAIELNNPVKSKRFWVVKASAHQQLGELSKAQEAMRYVQELTQGFFEKANQYKLMGDWKNASHYLWFAIQFDPDQVDLRYYLALALFETHKQGNPQALIYIDFHLKEILARRPDYPGLAEAIRQFQALKQAGAYSF